MKKIHSNKYKIEKFIIKGEAYIIAEAFILETYVYSTICKPSLGDVAIDAGAYYGETAFWFSKYIGKSGKVFAFKPLKNNFEILKKNIIENSLNDVITAIKKGIGETTEVKYISGYGMSAIVYHAKKSSKGECIEATTIDTFVKANKIKHVNFIKMDIEGAELSALKGAQETLKKFKPKLAICVYHKGEDIIEIPKYLISTVPQYTAQGFINISAKHNIIRTCGFQRLRYCIDKRVQCMLNCIM